jgi:hypothetical protein
MKGFLKFSGMFLMKSAINCQAQLAAVENLFIRKIFQKPFATTEAGFGKKKSISISWKQM